MTNEYQESNLPGWSGIPRSQVVAIETELSGGIIQVGSGYRVSDRHVLTAEHCTRDMLGARQVVRRSVVAGGSRAMVTEQPVTCGGLDLAVLILSAVPADWPDYSQLPAAGRVNRKLSGELKDCVAIGYPSWQYDPGTNKRASAELHGAINRTDQDENHRLLLRITGYDAVRKTNEDSDGDSPWGGLSGALVFHQGLALGVVTEHHPRQGTAVQLAAFDTLAQYAAADLSGFPEADRQRFGGAKAVAQALGLASLAKMPLTETAAARRLIRTENWVFAPRAARRHFEERARGQVGLASGDDLFTGRAAAVAEVFRWLAAPPAELPLVVTGQPGAGKSALTARVTMELARAGAAGLAFHAANATGRDFEAALGQLASLSADADELKIMDEIAEMGADSGALVMIDALDEMLTETDRTTMAQTIRRLAVLPGIRVIVATRPLTSGDRFAFGSMLRVLGAGNPKSANLIDLDDDRYFDLADLQGYVAKVLEHGGDTQVYPTSAWRQYRADKALRVRVASAIATQADGSYLVAGLTARIVSEDEDVVTFSNGQPPRFPRTAGEVLDKYLSRLSPGQAAHLRGVLIGLAYAEGDGVDDALWRQFGQAIGNQPEAGDFDQLRMTDLLVQHDSPAGVITGIFHLALREQLLSVRKAQAPSDQRSIADMLFKTAADTAQAQGWEHHHPYIRRYLAVHASAADQPDAMLGQLLQRADLLCAAEPGPLLEALKDYGGPLTGHVQAYERFFGHRLTSAPEEWPAYLGLASARAGVADLAAGAALLPGGSRWSPRWADKTAVAAHAVLDHQDGEVRAVLPLRIGGRTVICAAFDGGFPDHPASAIRLIDLEHGICVGQVGWDASDLAVSDPAATPVVCASNQQDQLLIWEPEREEAPAVVGIADLLDCGPLTSSPQVAIGQIDGAAIIVATGYGSSTAVIALNPDGTFRWRTPLDHSVPRVAVSRLGAADVAVISTTGRRDECTIRALALSDGSILGTWQLGRLGTRAGLTILPGNGKTRLAYPSPSALNIVELEIGAEPSIRSVKAEVGLHPLLAAVDRGDASLLAAVNAGTDDLRFHALNDDLSLTTTRPGAPPTALTALAVARHHYIVTGHADGTVRRWRLDILLGQASDTLPAGRAGQIAIPPAADVQVAYVGHAGRVQYRDLASGQVLAESPDKFIPSRLRIISLAGVAEQLTACVQSGLLTLSPDQLEVTAQHYTAALRQLRDIDTTKVGDRTYLATAGFANLGTGADARYGIDIWRAETMEHQGRITVPGYEDKAFCAVRFARRHGRVVIVAGGAAGYVYLWDLDQALAGETLWDGSADIDNEVVAVHDTYIWAIATDPQRPHRFISAGDDGLIRITDLDTGQQVMAQLPHHGRLNACSLANGLALAGGESGTLAASNADVALSGEASPASGGTAPILQIQIGSQINDIVAYPGGVGIATDDGALALRITL